MQRFPILLVLCVVVLTTVLNALAILPSRAADDHNYGQIAQQIRSELFSAQVELINNDPAQAMVHVKAAEQLYQTSVRPAILAELPDQVFLLDDAFAQTNDAIRAPGWLMPYVFGALRSQIWTRLLGTGYLMTMKALEREDMPTAQAWGLLREYRTSTRVTRPDTDATLALQALGEGTLTAQEAMGVVRADFLKTYQSLMNESLHDLDDAYKRSSWYVYCEKIGLAAGYFEILAPTYGEQHGDQALMAAQDTFEQLWGVALTGSFTNFEVLYDNVQLILSGFIAVPVEENELGQRAAQLLRIAAMVPVDYERGVRNGQVFNDIEYQEARTFVASIRSAFADLRSALQAANPDAAVSTEKLVEQLKQQVETLAEPTQVTDTANQLIVSIGKLLPPQWWKLNQQSDIDSIRAILNEVRTEALAGRYDQALEACTVIYFILQQSLEQKLLAFAPDVALRLDMLLWHGEKGHTGLAVMLGSGASINDIYRAIQQMNAALDEAEIALSSTIAPESAVGNAAIVVFREGLEAILILAALLAGLRGKESRPYRRLLGVGAVLALPIIVGLWFTLASVLRSFDTSGAALESAVSLISIVVLLVTTNWLFHKYYWTDWLAYFHREKVRLMGVGGIALVALGFFSILREGLEIVLFLQPLTLNVGTDVIWLGLGLGLVGVCICGLLVFWLESRLPFKKMLILTGLLLCIVLAIMIGNTVYHMQVADWLPITPVAGLMLPAWVGRWLGVYPTWQGIVAQISGVALLIGGYLIVELRRSLTRHKNAPNLMGQP